MGELRGLVLNARGNRLRARNAAQARRMEKKAGMQADRRAADEERLAERKHKETTTMDM